MSGNIYLGATEYSVDEREGFVSITIKRDGDTSKAVSVSYATNPDTAAPGTDYTAASGTAVIAAGATSTTIRIPVLNDALGEPSETFNISLINVDSGTLLFPRTTLVTILDDENPVTEPVNPPQTSPYQVKTVDAVTGLSGPMQIEWLEGSNVALVSEKEGRIKLVDFESGKVVSTLLDITAKVNSDADRGLLDIALHPDFENNPYLYAYYVADPADVKANGAASADNLGNRYAHLVRYELDLSGATPVIKPGTETVIVGGAGKSLADISGGGALDYTDPIHADKRASDMNEDGTFKQDYIKVDSRSHAGGAIAFGPDGALYVSTGDGTSYNYADPRTAFVQNVNSLSGKVLRIDPLTGEGFRDNPYATADLDSNASKVWQTGLRNPYAMTFSEDGRIMISETGWYSWEEINSGGKGANYGWPYYEGADNGEVNKTPGYQTMPGAAQFYADVANGKIVVTPAFRAFSHEPRDPGVDIQAIVGGTTVYTGDKYPDIFKGDYFFSDIVDGDIFTVDVNDRTQLQYVTNIGTYHAVSFVQGPDGYVYYSDITGNKIVRIEITDPNAVPNRAPVVASPIADAEAIVGKAISITLPGAVFSDADGDQLALTATLADGQPLPSWLTFNAATKTFNGMAPAGATAVEIRVSATDPDGLATNDLFRLTIGGEAANVAPIVATAIADQTGTVGLNWSYKLPAGTFTDGDSDALTLFATQANGQSLPGWVSFNAQTGSFTGTPPAGTTGSFTFRVTATDPEGAAVSDDFVLSVGAAPENLVQDVARQNQFVSGATANDVFVYAGKSSLYQWGPSEDGKSLIVWTRSATDTTYDVLTGFEKLRFSDKTVNLVETTQGPDYRDISDEIQNLTGKTAADRFIINGKSADYAWGNTQDGKGIVIWTLSATDDTYDILNSFDQLVFTDKTVYLTGTPPANVAPVVANAIADQTVAQEASFSFELPSNTFSDADGHAMALSATLANGAALPAWLKFDSATRTFSGKPDESQVGTLSIKVTASDGHGGSASDTFDIKVTPTNTAPVVGNPITDQIVAEEANFSFELPRDTFSDAEGHALVLSATRVGGGILPDWLKFDAATRTFSGMPDDSSVGNLSIEVTARDGHGGSVSDTFDIRITPVNDAPWIRFPIADQTAIQGREFSFAVPASSFADVDGGALVLSAKLADGSPLPAWLNFDPVARLFSGMTPADAGPLSIAVTADDGYGGVATDTFDLQAVAPAEEPGATKLLPDFKVNEDKGFTYLLSANSFPGLDSETITYTATSSSSSHLPFWLNFSPKSGNFYGVPGDSDVGSVEVIVRASDAKGGQAWDKFTITVDPVNDAPRFVQPFYPPNAVAGEPYHLDMWAVDDDDRSLTYAATLADGKALPAWLKMDPGTGLFSGVPGEQDGGVHNIKVTATDAGGLSAVQTFRLYVEGRPGLNDAPVLIEPVSDYSIEALKQISFIDWNWSYNFGDVDQEDLTFTAQLANGDPLPSWLLHFGGTSFGGKPPESAVGDFDIVLTAHDKGGLSVSDTIKLTVTPVVNFEPRVLVPIADKTIAEGAPFKFEIFVPYVFNDANGDRLTLSVTLADGNPLPAWLKFDPTTSFLTGTPGEGDSGTIAIAVTASDHRGGSVTDTFDLTVAPVNDAPVLTKPLADFSVPHDGAGMMFTFSIPQGTFSDAEGDKLTYTATQADGSALPAWLSFDPALGLFRGQPPKFDTVSIKVTATDGKGGAVSDVFNIAMTPNHAPVVAVPVADQNLKEGEAFSINLGPTFTDADNDGLLFFVTLADGSPLPSWITVENNGRLLSGTVPEGAGSLSLKVAASDRNGGGVSDVFEIKVAGANAAPVVTTPIADQNAIHTWTFTFTLPVNTFTDADGDALTVSAKLADGSVLPTWLSFDAATRTFSGTPVGSDVGKTFAIAVTASDGKGGTVTDTFDIDVGQWDRPPRVFDAIEDQTGAAGTAFSFTVPNGTFADDNIVSYSATLADGEALPSWLKFDAATRTFSGTSPAGQASSFDIKVTAQDASGGTGSDVFKLTIAAKPAETLYQNTSGNQHIDAGGGHDVFVLGGNSSGYQWGPTEDGKGVVVWNNKGFDILFNFEELRFTSKTVAVSSVLGNGGSDFIDDANATQYLAGKTASDRFVIDGNAADYGWNKTQDGKSVVVWDRSGDDPHDILTGFDKLVFDDREVDISGLGTV